MRRVSRFWLMPLAAALLTGCRGGGLVDCPYTPPIASGAGGAATPIPVAVEEVVGRGAIEPAAERDGPRANDRDPGSTLPDSSDHATKDPFTEIALASEAIEEAPEVNAARPLTLDQSIAMALVRNPALQVARAGEPIAHAAYHVAETYPFNPYVQIQVLPYTRDRAGDALAVNHYVSLMQTLELAHQQERREASALASWNQVRWNIVQAELTTAAQTERLFFTTIYQRDLRDLADYTASLNDDLQKVVDRRFTAGLATTVELTTARVAARQSQRQAELAEATYRTAELALRRQLNLSADDPIELVGHLDDFVWLPVTATAGATESAATWTTKIASNRAAELAAARPDVLAARCGVGAASANADLARANQVQNVALGPFYERDESGTVLAGFRTQVNLPIWDNGHPLAEQRLAEACLQRVSHDQLWARARVEAETAIDRYERSVDIVERERSATGNASADELRSIKELYVRGQTDILSVFATQNSLLLESRTHLDILNEAAQAAADVTLMTGLPPARLIASKAGNDPRPREPSLP